MYSKMTKVRKSIRHSLEYVGFIILTGLLRLLPIDLSAGICAFLAKIVGPHLSATKIARNNLRKFLLVKGDDEDKIIQDLWDNFGRFIGEFPHIDKLSIEEVKSRIELLGMENIKAMQDAEQPFLILTGHFANWDFILRTAEILYPQFGIAYRKANNPMVDKLICKWRSRPNIHLIPKGSEGGRALVKSIKSRHSIAMLVDQKMNDGISVPFFGAPAMTAPAIAKFSLQFDYPIVPMQIIRKSGTHFKVILHPPLKPTVTGDSDQDIPALMTDINKILEEWIRQNPGQWFWFHNRWGSKTGASPE
jgi:KDO2-lipid IV(A) lauroyltransferase